DVVALGNACAKIKLNNKYGLFDLATIKEIVPFKYDDIGFLSNDIFLIKNGNKFGLLNKAGVEITETKYDEIKIVTNKLFLVKLNGKYGLVNDKGAEMSKVEYAEIKIADISKENEIKAWIKIPGTPDYYDLTGEKIKGD
ncbi:MAG: WG repeat-containing protein, partial [Chitinophagaceae bacterium]